MPDVLPKEQRLTGQHTSGYRREACLPKAGGRMQKGQEDGMGEPGDHPPSNL